ncbi:MAG: hypothetical protein V4476_28110 [Pseudomonadota bacterium]
MAREMGVGLLIGAGLVLSSFAVVAALGACRFGGVNALSFAMLLPLAELVPAPDLCRQGPNRRTAKV